MLNETPAAEDFTQLLKFLEQDEVGISHNMNLLYLHLE
jgi:hypothetical protein